MPQWISTWLNTEKACVGAVLKHRMKQNKYEKRKKTMEKESKEEKKANGYTIGKSCLLQISTGTAAINDLGATEKEEKEKRSYRNKNIQIMRGWWRDKRKVMEVFGKIRKLFSQLWYKKDFRHMRKGEKMKRMKSLHKGAREGRPY